MDRSPIFVVGCARSGTSLLRDLLRSDPEIEIPPESYFIPPFYTAWGDPGSDRQARALARRILSMKTVTRWELDLDPEAFAGCRSFAGMVDLLYGEFARADGASRWGDKTPPYLMEMPVLAGLFPEARFVHIHRDGRDVARSWVRMKFGPNNVFSAATAWRRWVTKGRRDGSSLGGRYKEVRFEALLASPEETMRGVCDFLDIPFTPAMLTRAPIGPIYARNKEVLERMLSRERIELGRASSWREEMPVSDRAVVESVAGDLLDELGYEVEGLGRPVPRLSRVRWTAGNGARIAINRVTRRELTLRNAALVWRAQLLGRLRSAI
jgi:hypothetical protein